MPNDTTGNEKIRNGCHHKRKHLCLYGESNAGKSTFCNASLGIKITCDHKNFPIGIYDTKLEFDRLNPNLYTHCIVHEFEFHLLELKCNIFQKKIHKKICFKFIIFVLFFH